ncbi:MAG: hypothetical protein KBS59_01430 [Clostridiales bacterium]|nr:hypothetical protein [Clostridiales bacterium]
MSKNIGYINLDRRILDWEHFKDHKAFKLFCVILLLAEYEDTELPDGTELERGQLAISTRKLAEISGLTHKEVRAQLRALERTHETAQLATRKNTIITVLNYDKYQYEGTAEGTQKGTQKGTVCREKEEKEREEKQKRKNKEEIRDIKKFSKNGRARANIIKDSPSFDIEEIERKMMFEDPIP